MKKIFTIKLDGKKLSDFETIVNLKFRKGTQQIYKLIEEFIKKNTALIPKVEEEKKREISSDDDVF